MGLLDALFPPNVQKLKAKRDVTGLLKAMQSSSEEIRKEAAAALGELEVKEAVPALVACLRNDGRRLVRVAAAVALGKIGGEQAEEALSAQVVSEGDSDAAALEIL
jgi:epoxyqueuosine reductase